MTAYKDLFLVNTKAMYEKALTGHYAVPGLNFKTLEQAQAIVQACIETRTPLLLQYHPLPDEKLHPAMILGLVRGAVEMAAGRIDVGFHLDHGDSFEQCKACIDGGYSSVMIDGSQLPLAANITLTSKVVDYAHAHDVTVEGELGGIAGREASSGPMRHQYTDPGEVESFVNATGIDSLAVSIGTAHGAFKNIATPGGALPALRFDILSEIKRRLPRLPIVLHGASAIPQDLVAIMTTHGGSMPRAAGIPDEQIRKAIAINVCKVNVHTDTQIAMTGAIRAHLAANPECYDPREYLEAARVAVATCCIQKIRDVLGSAGKATSAPIRPNN